MVPLSKDKIMNKVTHIGVLVFNKYEDNVTLKGVNTQDIANILLTDKDVKWFEIRTIADNKCVERFKMSQKTERDEEILGHTYNAFADKPHTYKTKVTWQNIAGSFKTKKEAERQRERYNNTEFSLMCKAIYKATGETITL